MQELPSGKIDEEKVREIRIDSLLPHLCSLSPSSRLKRLILMLKGFFDETNRDPARSYFIMAGWVATVEEWNRFEESWFNTGLYATPSIDYFKWSESESLGGQFTTFGTKKRNDKRTSLAQIIAAHGLLGYFVLIPHRILAGKPPILRKLMGTRIYDWAFIALVCGVLGDSLRRGNSFETVDFTFDGCTELRACIADYEHKRERFPLDMRAIAGKAKPGDDKKLAGIQAADLLAGELSHELKMGRTGNCLAIMRTSRRIRRLHLVRPDPSLERLVMYAHQVYGRQQLTKEILKLLNEKGITIDELNKFGV